MTLRRLLGGLLGAALLLGAGTGCQQGPAAPRRAATVVDPGSPAPTPSALAELPVAPLTGRTTSAAVARRPALAVPLRVTPGTSPVGVGAADLLFQEYAEDDSLHVMTVFQSHDMALVGPATEIRPADLRTVGVLNPLVGFTGGPTGFLSQLADSGLRGVTPAQRPAAFRNGYTGTQALYRALPPGLVAPPAIFDYAAPGTPLAIQGAAPARVLTVTAPGHAPQVWRYDGASRSWRGQLGRTTVAAASVVVLTMPYRTLEVRKPALRRLPSATVYGAGAALTVSGPAVARGTWRKPGQQLVCHVTDGGGNPVRPLPGLAWVVYAPPNAVVVVR